MESIITMIIKELGKMEVFSKLKEKSLTQMQAANILGISYRQVRRLFLEAKSEFSSSLFSAEVLLQ